MPEIRTLNVLLYGEYIGSIVLLPGEQTLFSFHPSYSENLKRPLLSLSFKDTTGGLLTTIRPSRRQLPPFFSNLLPEGHMRDYLARLADVKPSREFFLLLALGQDLPGAITVVPGEGEERVPELTPAHQPGSHEHMLRFSLAGVQLKFSAVIDRKGGLAIPAEGVGGLWIVKLPSERFVSVPENEYSMMSLAKMTGIDIPDIQLVPLTSIANLPEEMGKLKGPAFAIRRFDRSENGPVHMEDFAQVFGVYPDDKYTRGNYKNIAEVLWKEAGEEGVAEFIRRLVFNTLIGNADMHLKNWSLLYPDRYHAQLSPGYDFVSTIPYIHDDTMALNYVKSKRMTELSVEMLVYLAAKAGLPERLVVRVAKETVVRFKEVWESERKHLPLAAQVIEAIEKHLVKVPLVGEV